MNQVLQQYTYDPRILQAVTELLHYYAGKHSKIMCVRFDLTFPLNFPRVNNNLQISLFSAALVQKYTRMKYDPTYIWAREQHRSIHPHYHFALLLNGHKTQSYKHVLASAEEIWQRILNVDITGCVHYCCNNPSDNFKYHNGQILRKDNEDFQTHYNEVLYRLSYLAKSYSKSYDDDGMRNFGMSRI